MPNPVIAKMMDRLFASMINGPSLNCRPHAKPAASTPSRGTWRTTWRLGSAATGRVRWRQRRCDPD